jgi:hypothetical protein
MLGEICSIHERRYGLDRDENMTEPPTRIYDDDSDPEPDGPSAYQNYSHAGHYEGGYWLYFVRLYEEFNMVL